MSELQMEATRMINGLSDDSTRVLIEVIKLISPYDKMKATSGPVQVHVKSTNDKMEAYRRLEEVRLEAKQYFPDDFDYDKELEEARAERYGSAY